MQVIYLVIRFPGACFASPEEDCKQNELPITVGEQSVMRSSRITLRGTVTIPLPERDVHRFVVECVSYLYAEKKGAYMRMRVCVCVYSYLAWHCYHPAA